MLSPHLSHNRQGTLTAACLSGYLDSMEETSTPNQDAGDQAGIIGPAPYGERIVLLTQQCRDLTLRIKHANSAGSLYVALRESSNLATAVDLLMRMQTEQLRDGGSSWSAIAQTIGVTKQAAWERYGAQ